MKNMRVSKKLLISFVIVIIMTVVVGSAGIIGMSQINDASSKIYSEQTIPIVWLATAVEDIQNIRIYSREYIAAVLQDDYGRIETLFNDTRRTSEDVIRNFDLFEPILETERGRALFSEARKIFENEYQQYLNRIYELARAGDIYGILEETKVIAPYLNTVIDNLAETMSVREGLASGANAANASLYRILMIVIVAVISIVIAIALFLAFYISGIISKPLTAFAAFMRYASTTGDIVLSEKDKGIIEKYGKNKDEIGQCIFATSEFIKEINVEMDLLEKVADGNLDIMPNILSDKDKIGKALTKVLDNLNDMFGEINLASEQVSSGSQQIADGAQTLAQGSTEQAATTQELSASAQEISEQTKVNAQMAQKAAELAGTIKVNAEKGSSRMDDMVSAVNEISQASQSISKVIKAIDDIAFQTNILALNAAVEAARAGVHGKGFAVVAEEVRNLAAKSAEAAKDTGSLIANSMEKAEQGAIIAKDTAESLADIVAGINESSAIINEIAVASERQTSGIAQINNGIDQVATVVQQNSATAEESAAAAEELSGQSAMLKNLIGQFKLRKPANAFSHSVAKTPKKSVKMPLKNEVVNIEPDMHIDIDTETVEPVFISGGEKY